MDDDDVVTLPPPGPRRRIDFYEHMEVLVITGEFKGYHGAIIQSREIHEDTVLRVRMTARNAAPWMELDDVVELQ